MTTRLELRGEVDSLVGDGLTRAWQRYAGELYGLAYRLLGNAADADEAVQETFVRAWVSADRYDRERPLRPWLFTILRHLVVDELRARAQRRRLAERMAHQDLAAPPPERILDACLDRRVLACALSRLDASQREVLTDVYLHGRSYSEVSAALGISDVGARTRVFHARRALRRVLEDLDWAA
jgi:RNA polymerase sigma-70 factor, ECF subfamily